MKRIKLTQGKWALVDDSDFERLNQWKWFADKQGNTFYAVRNSATINGKQTRIRMHRVIMNTHEGMETDHADRNGLNNQKHNLRICTKSQNRMNRKKYVKNSSKYKGVTWAKYAKKWRARIQINIKAIFLGHFLLEEEAALAYNKKAKELFGEFAYLNKIK